jgi:ribosomal protein S18 acetylase RimI-like enzyme
VALEGDDVVGAMFGYCYPWQDRINYYMQELFVEADRRRSGHGRNLVRHLLARLGESDASMSLIANEATPAAAFYQELGLRRHRYYKFYYGTVSTDAE